MDKENLIKRIGSFLIILLFPLISIAQEVNIEVSPSKPVKGEIFKVYFKIKSKNGSNPSISFNPYNLEVLGREGQGVSTRTTYINGQLSISREINIAYEMLASKSGQARIDDIVVEINGQKVTHKRVYINVLNKPKAATNHMLLAIPSKTDVYVGESVMLNYYIYSKGQITGREIRKFPKLKDFVKRFIQKPEVLERVQYNGEIYNRRLIYSSQLFPNKPGKIVIDSMTAGIRYPDRRSNPFGGFGFSLLNKSKVITSPPVYLNVRELPQTNDSSFTKLVGQHEVNIRLNKNKFLVNEPIEISLEFKGPGLLENFDAPKLLNSNSLEEFDSSADLKLGTSEIATKLFNFTYLARESTKIPSRELRFSFLNPSSGNIETKIVRIPEISIKGGAFKGKSSGNTPTVSNKIEVKQAVRKRSLVAPIFSKSIVIKDWFIFLNIGLFFIFIILSFINIDFSKIKIFDKKPHNRLINKIKKGGANYSDLFLLFSYLNTGHENLEEVLEETKISKDAKKYFKKIISSVERKNYSVDGKSDPFKFSSKYFGELEKEIDNANL